MEDKKQFSIFEGFKLFLLLMIFVEVGAILSNLSFDRTIFKFNISLAVIILIVYSYYFLSKKKELKSEE